jgi:hypothetical protein
MDLSAIDAPIPSMKYRTLAGRIMEFNWQPHAEPYNEHLKVNGSPIVFSRELLHKNPMVHQKTGGPLMIQLHGRRLTYDFEKWSKTESTVSGNPPEGP